jgi:hypothetical protein
MKRHRQTNTTNQNTVTAAREAIDSFDFRRLPIAICRVERALARSRNDEQSTADLRRAYDELLVRRKDWDDLLRLLTEVLGPCDPGTAATAARQLQDHANKMVGGGGASAQGPDRTCSAHIAAWQHTIALLTAEDNLQRTAEQPVQNLNLSQYSKALRELALAIHDRNPTVAERLGALRGASRQARALLDSPAIDSPACDAPPHMVVLRSLTTGADHIARELFDFVLKEARRAATTFSLGALELAYRSALAVSQQSTEPDDNRLALKEAIGRREPRRAALRDLTARLHDLLTARDRPAFNAAADSLAATCEISLAVPQGALLPGRPATEWEAWEAQAWRAVIGRLIEACAPESPSTDEPWLAPTPYADMSEYALVLHDLFDALSKVSSNDPADESQCHALQAAILYAAWFNAGLSNKAHASDLCAQLACVLEAQIRTAELVLAQALLALRDSPETPAATV